VVHFSVFEKDLSLIDCFPSGLLSERPGKSHCIAIPQTCYGEGNSSFVDVDTCVRLTINGIHEVRSKGFPLDALEKLFN